MMPLRGVDVTQLVTNGQVWVSSHRRRVTIEKPTDVAGFDMMKISPMLLLPVPDSIYRWTSRDSLVLGLMVASLLGPSIAWASEPSGGSRNDAVGSSSQPSRGSADAGPLRIEVDPRIVDAELIPGWIAARHTGIGQHVVVDPGEDAWIAVEVSGATYDYRLEVTAMRGGEPLGDVFAAVACECSGDEMLEALDIEIERAIGQLEAARSVSEPAPVRSVSELEPAKLAPSPMPPDPCHGRKLCWTRVGVAGVGVMGGGVGAVVGGITMVALGRPEIVNRTYLYRNWRPPGYLALGVGGAALIAGAMMLTIDLVRCRKDAVKYGCTARKAGSPRAAVLQLSFGPWMFAGTAGPAMRGRF